MKLDNRTAAIIGLALCMFVTSLSWMMLSVPEFFIEVDLGWGNGAWILSAYIIAEVSVLPVAGKLIDRHGPRRIVAVGAILFVIASVVCSFSTTVDQMVVVRVFQGIGAGMVFAVALASIGLLYPKDSIGKPHEMMTAAFAFGSLYGTMVGYWLALNTDWHYTYYLSAVLMIVGGAVAYRFLPDGGKDVGHDRVGAVLVTVLVADLMFFSQLVNKEFEILSIESAMMIMVAVLSMMILYLAEKVSSDPMIPRGISRTQAGCMLCMFLAGFCGLGMVQFLMKFMLLGMSVDIYTASLMFLFLLGGGACTSMTGLKKMNETGIRPWALAGPVLVMVGFLVASFTLTMGLPFVAVSLFILGLGLGCIVTEMLCAVQQGSGCEHMGTMTSLTMTSRFVGILVGAAVFSAIIEHMLMIEFESLILDNPGLTIGDILANYDYYFLDIVQVFEGSVMMCCMAAAALSLTILVSVYFLIERD